MGSQVVATAAVLLLLALTVPGGHADICQMTLDACTRQSVGGPCDACAPKLSLFPKIRSALSGAFSSALSSLNNKTGMLAKVEQSIAKFVSQALSEVDCQITIPLSSGSTIQNSSNPACQSLPLDPNTYYYTYSILVPAPACVAIEPCNYTTFVSLPGTSFLLPIGNSDLVSSMTVPVYTVVALGKKLTVQTAQLWNLKAGLNSFSSVTAIGDIYVSGQVKANLTSRVFSISMDAQAQLMAGYGTGVNAKTISIYYNSTGKAPSISFRGQRVSISPNNTASNLWLKFVSPTNFVVQLKLGGPTSLQDIVAGMPIAANQLVQLMAAADFNVRVVADIYIDATQWGVSLSLLNATSIKLSPVVRKALSLPDTMPTKARLVVRGTMNSTGAIVSAIVNGATKFSINLCKVNSDCVAAGAKCINVLKIIGYCK